MRPHRSLFIPWLASVTQAIDTCGYLVTDPLAANLLHARDACSSFQQSTTSLCPTTTTTTRIITVTTPGTTVATLTITNNATVTTTLVTTIVPTAVTVTTTRTTNLAAQPTGPIAGSLDKRSSVEERAAEVIPCPRLYGPEVPGPFAFFCQAPAFASACKRVGISATIQTKQSKATVTASSTTTIANVVSLATSVTTTATINATVTATTSLATATTTVGAVETRVPRIGPFVVNYNGVSSGRLGGTSAQAASDPLTLTTYNGNRGRYNGNFVFSIGTSQGLLAGTSYQFPTFVTQGNNSGVIDYVVRYSGFTTEQAVNILRCELSAPPKGVLSCTSNSDSGKLTTLFQTCNGDGQLYHGPGLLPGCSALQLSVA